MMGVCPVCGSGFDATVSKGTRKEYCSRACRLVMQRKRRKPMDMRAADAYRKRMRMLNDRPPEPPEPEPPAAPPHVCGFCGGPLPGRHTKWCGRSCMMRAKTAHKPKKSPTPYQKLRREFKKVRGGVMAESGGVCQKCGGVASQVHHVVPLADGGTNDLDNLVALCGPCHVAEHPELNRHFTAGLLAL